MFLLLVLLACLSFPLSAIAPCPLPAEVSPSDYPDDWTRGGDFILTNDGTNDLLDCATSFFIGQYGVEAQAWTIGGMWELGKTFRCDPTSLKWIRVSDGFEAPPLLNCGTPPPNHGTYCSITHKQPNDVSGVSFIHPDHEMYCPAGQIMTWERDVPAIVLYISCSVEDSHGFALHIFGCEDAYGFTSNYRINLSCAPPYCPVRFEHSNGTLERITLKPNEEQIMTQLCASTETLQYYGRSVRTDMKCSASGLAFTFTDGDTDKDRCPEFTCATSITCPIKNQMSNGTFEDITLTPGKEQYCPSGELIRFAHGATVKDIKCKGGGLEITGEDGAVIAYSGPNMPTLTCAATCPIRNWLPSGALENKVIEAGKEQYCPDGQIVASSDGKPLKDIKCTRAALTVETEDGRTMSYPKPLTRATLKCVPGICKKVCAGPTTTTSTTTVAPTTTTTTVAPDRPPTANQLWNFNFYYNYNRILHAFCSDQTCINAIQANGIGYDMVQYWDVIGRAIREDAITAVRAACPTGSANLVNLGFTRVGNHYEHNFSGSGLKQGWVSLVNGACGASVAVKRWKCRMGEDMMYDSKSLETNTYYQELVMDGGRAQFYLW